MPGDPRLDAELGRMARDELPWGQAWKADFSAFADRFTLHDSLWIGIFLNVRETKEAVLVVEWDAHWLPEPLRTDALKGSPGPPGFGDPLLFMRTPELVAVQLSGYDQSCGGRAIDDLTWSVDGKVNTVEIFDIIDGVVRLHFGGTMDFLALDRQNGEVLALEKVEPRLEQATPAKPWWRIW